jgi:CheY-like chemotaxis protein/HPt (histidine-containing phosphotransfer) domain-containing protein
MHGDIGVESMPGKGSTFWFTVPFGISDIPESEDIPIQGIEDLKLRGDQPEPVNKNLQILLAEDYPTNQQIAIRHLTNAGFHVFLAENGKKAVELFQQRQFDLVLMDIQMPVMDGYKAAEAIRVYEEKNGKSKAGKPRGRVPVIALTAHAMKGYREKCLAAGMDDYLAKPLKRRELLEMVTRWTSGLKKKTFHVPEESLSGLDDIPFDRNRALVEFDHDDSFLCELVKEFMGQVKQQIKIIEKALESGDSKTVKKQAHSIKGGAANLAADPLSRAASRLEAAACDAEPDQLARLADSLIHEYKRLERACEPFCRSFS